MNRAIYSSILDHNEPFDNWYNRNAKSSVLRATLLGMLAQAGAATETNHRCRRVIGRTHPRCGAGIHWRGIRAKPQRISPNDAVAEYRFATREGRRDRVPR